MNRLLPESHTDFVFSVGADGVGIALGAALVALLSFIIIRALVRALRTNDPGGDQDR